MKELQIIHFSFVPILVRKSSACSLRVPRELIFLSSVDESFKWLSHLGYFGEISLNFITNSFGHLLDLKKLTFSSLPSLNKVTFIPLVNLFQCQSVIDQ